MQISIYLSKSDLFFFLNLIPFSIIFLLGRLIIGFCFGGWSSIGSLYSIELAPKQYKGLSGIIYSLYFGFGIFTAFLTGYGLPSDPAESATNSYWRFMLGLPIFFSVLMILAFVMWFTDETPAFLYVTCKDEINTKRVLNKFLVPQIANEEFNDLA